MSDSRNLFVAIFLSTLILIGWQYFYEKPRVEQAAKVAELQKKQSAAVALSHSAAADVNEETLEQGFAEGRRVRVETESLHGSISLKGARFDDLTLAGYRTDVKKESSEVVLLAPTSSKAAYFAEFGWLSPQGNITLPTQSTVWSADKKVLRANDTVTLSWTNPQQIRFELQVSLDAHYMFTIKQRVVNTSPQNIALSPYGLLQKRWVEDHQVFAILHEGALGVFNGVLTETTYSALRKDNKKEFKQVEQGWLGITDKYWLTAIVPDRSQAFDAHFTHHTRQGQDRFQVDYLGESTDIKSGASKDTTYYFFAGAKRLGLLDNYSVNLGIPLFDRAVDFGMFYFLTKPMFTLLQFLHHHVGNVGIAILLVTVLVKLAMFPLANKSYRAMARMKVLQPEITALRERHKDDKMKLNQGIMELYKKEGVNPLAGCLPILIQIPVFFSLYKVLFITIEMRHAPFFGWIKDLSAPDPTSIFNLFGLLPWSPPAALLIGIWPIVMGITMYLQQQMNPQPADPMQAKFMKFLPFFFVYLFHNFPAGLIIYWAWNNTLSILQQWIITKTSSQK